MARSRARSPRGFAKHQDEAIRLSQHRTFIADLIARIVGPPQQIALAGEFQTVRLDILYRVGLVARYTLI
jgi:hypothetical protein